MAFKHSCRSWTICAKKPSRLF